MFLFELEIIWLKIILGKDLVMSFNPFNQKTRQISDTFMNWKQMDAKPYNKAVDDPFTKLRVIMLNGAEYEAVGFSHRFSRNCSDNDVRRSLAMIRRSEQQQQKLVSGLKPLDETILETTIGYEQLAVELTAMLAQLESDEYVRRAFDFALLEDFDHLYRYANLLEMDMGVKAEQLVEEYTEIMPGRPTISEHRSPNDEIRRFTNCKKATPQTALNINIITAAEQQTMNYYMNIAGFYNNKLGRNLYNEIAMIEEQHVTHYGSLLDAKMSMYEQLVMHEYTECYLYYSAMNDETNKKIKSIWEQCFEMELCHLSEAVRLLNKYEKKEWQQVISTGEFPELLKFKSNIEYVRNAMRSIVNITGKNEDYVSINALEPESEFYKYQEAVNGDISTVSSHAVILKSIDENGKDYRYEQSPHPIPELANRKKDNTDVGRFIVRQKAEKE